MEATSEAPSQTVLDAAPPARGCAGQATCRYLYASRLAPRQPVTVVGALLTQARERNRQLGLTGALLFDGEHFVQLLEGPGEVVDALARRIEADARHAGVAVFLHAADARPPLFDGWSGGWAEPEALQDFLALERSDTTRLLDAFKKLVEGSDMQ
ncbi:BLUF domain-containing protein [Azohydromonas caseinilytica]|uniref:BLUF domain-containing protein n=1 Tax=Azohydromonas caseinilytica TaxID=2728836 RepID=A0A848FK20_9BURK|nr:BLUF domain-containing protein [Azohydromonas caseinilytica]NML18583.1 BLUF domain-containing protein [Azohydromonas caseinilytica]